MTLPYRGLRARIESVRKRRRASDNVAGRPSLLPTRFFRLIEFQTSRIDDVRALHRRWLNETACTVAATSMHMAGDCDRHNRYVWILEFPSREDAACIDALEETPYVAEQLSKLADGPAVVRNLDALGG